MPKKHLNLIMMAVLFLAITLTAIPILLYRRNDAFAIIFFLYGVFCVASIRCLRGFWRPVTWNLAVILFCLAGAEAYFAGYAKKGTGKPRTRYTPSHYYQDDPALGYGAHQGVQVNARKTFHGEDLYNVDYTINEHGFRQGKSTAGDLPPSVLFFGGSFTFGEGLDDHQTFPWQFQELKGDTLQSINLGFHGYGTHQMLKMLEDHREQEAVAGTKPVLAVYFCIPEHLRRVAGRASWDSRGPRYVLQKDGTVQYTGPFQNKITANIQRALTRSHLYREIHSRLQESSKDKASLLVGIANSSRKILRDRYNVDLIVVLHGPPKRTEFQEIHKQLQEANFKVLDINTLVPEYDPTDASFVIPNDGHPTAKYNRHIAEMLVEELQFDHATAE